MANTELLHPFSAEGTKTRTAINRAKIKGDADSVVEDAVELGAAPVAAIDECSGQAALKSPRLHFFRGTFKLFGQSLNAGFVALFVADLAAMAFVFNTLITPNNASFFFAAVVSFSMVCMGLYDARQRETVRGVAFHLLAALSLSLLVSVVTVKTLDMGPVSGSELLHATAWSFLLLAALRFLFHSVVDGRVLRRRVLVVGTGKRARFIERLRRKADQRGFELVGFVASNTCQHCYIQSDKLISIESGLCEFALNHEVDEIVIALDDRRSGLPTDELLDCRMSGIKVTKDLDFFEREASLVQLDLIQPGWLIHAQGFNSNTFRYWEKRLFDIAGSLLLLIFLSPVMLLTAIAIMIECGLGSTIFYNQERVGRGGKSFTLFKFRSMCEDAEAEGEAQWAKKKDPRVTRVGNVIRKYRIDEIPQLWNVIRGDMSLVGPRPERPQFVTSLREKNAFYHERHRVAPGLTGWAQLCFPYGASEDDSIQKLKFDLYYIKNHGLIFDFYILAQTAEVVLFQRGSR
ncbi:MAG: TIGR03013 family PEP-CTERM/XrtA system glycosyltransferase [Gammaproteobacteria bacterium]|nr:TIGR03013 family PEP-CTERM/XrtA system glycosyltransferase [Gammaproteobacteria bacterium]